MQQIWADEPLDRDRLEEDVEPREAGRVQLAVGQRDHKLRIHELVADGTMSVKRRIAHWHPRSQGRSALSFA